MIALVQDSGGVRDSAEVGALMPGTWEGRAGRSPVRRTGGQQDRADPGAQPEGLSTLAPGITRVRSTLVRADGSIFAHMLSAPADALHAYAGVSLHDLAGQQPLLLRVGAGMLGTLRQIDREDADMWIVIGADDVAFPDTLETLADMVDDGWSLVLDDFTATSGQSIALDFASAVMVSAHTSRERLAVDLAPARGHGVPIIVKDVDDEPAKQTAASLGADFFIGSMAPRTATKHIVSGQLQCLRLVGMLAEETTAPRDITQMVRSDPGLSLKALRLVNSTAVGLSRHINSVETAVALLGRNRLSALAAGELGGAQDNATATLWSVLTRARTLADLTDDEIGYTIGLMSAAADLCGMDMDTLIATARVSPEVSGALLRFEGPLGQAHGAVLAFGRGDMPAVRAFGYDPERVSDANFGAVIATWRMAEAVVKG